MNYDTKTTYSDWDFPKQNKINGHLITALECYSILCSRSNRYLIRGTFLGRMAFAVEWKELSVKSWE